MLIGSRYLNKDRGDRIEYRLQVTGCRLQRKPYLFKKR
jgi:hypothetical protein